MSTTQSLDFFRTSRHNPSFYEIRSKTSYKGELQDFCIPVNSYFPPQRMTEMIRENLETILKYYPEYADTHQHHISLLTGIAPENIVVSNGSTEIITMLCRDIDGPMVTSIPTFGRWTDLPFALGVSTSFIQRDKRNSDYP